MQTNYCQHWQKRHSWLLDTRSTVIKLNIGRLTSNADRHSESRPAPRCMVLPPGELNGIIPEPLTVHFEGRPICNRFHTVILLSKLQSYKRDRKQHLACSNVIIPGVLWSRPIRTPVLLHHSHCRQPARPPALDEGNVSLAPVAGWRC